MRKEWIGIVFGDDLQKWIVDYAPGLENGNHKITLPASSPIEFPIVMHVWKEPTPSIVGFARFEPEDDTLPARIRKLLDRKAMKLRKYQGSSGTTMLLVENDDIALMSEAKMLDALLRSVRRWTSSRSRRNLVRRHVHNGQATVSRLHDKDRERQALEHFPIILVHILS